MEENYPESNWSTYNEDVPEGAGKPDQYHDRLLVVLPVTRPQFWFTGTEQVVLGKNITQAQQISRHPIAFCFPHPAAGKSLSTKATYLSYINPQI